MSIFSEFRNERLIRELDRELNTDVILFGFDGFSYFGNLQAVEDCRLAIMTPAIEAKSNDVEILTPGGEVRHVDFARIDLWQLVGKGTGIVRDPFKTCSNISGTVIRSDDPEALNERQESHCLIHELRRMVGDEVVITTLGGFLFEGTLTTVEDCLAILKVAKILVPGTSSAIGDTKVRSAVVNLEAITSISGVCCC
jgi:small nuclear ribonucleoprotein (snRNP)-like protein